VGQLGGDAAKLAHNIRILEGLQPSKPPSEKISLL
jgi:hypothetical protein